ncbi:thiamine phosphate synthase [Candidatus Nitrospira allomarina]|jgi:thiamine-phosphate pyrophosphorylase|uniref:Thiamine-phosphate synthase n=1 Tax=Candidatus Nitrospira allomarina TaxID=3020900 RepID=A0AA96JS78_9BACT|nr:thiamine phosphate synthase [Candidatus Nitrospira allomarina]WNM58317.1 thiamine phosphate synthase [Candidatus Nitrospira allomarina]
MSSRILPRLYLLTDRHQTLHRPLTSVITEAVDAGVRMVQIREKDLTTRELTSLCQQLGPLIKHRQGTILLNDRIDLVLALGADGVHLRTDSLPVSVARRLLGTGHLIGVSTHSVEEARVAEGEGADFIVLGPIFDTPSKRAYGPPLGIQVLRETSRFLHLPIYAIGGITPIRIPDVLSAGAYGVAVISSILQSPSIPDTTRELLARLS